MATRGGSDETDEVARDDIQNDFLQKSLFLVARAS